MTCTVNAASATSHTHTPAPSLCVCVCVSLPVFVQMILVTLHECPEEIWCNVSRVLHSGFQCSSASEH